MADILRLFNDINFELHRKLKSFLVVVKLINTLQTEEKNARGKVSFDLNLEPRMETLNQSHPAFTCLKLTKDTLEQGVKYVQS